MLLLKYVHDARLKSYISDKNNKKLNQSVLKDCIAEYDKYINSFRLYIKENNFEEQVNILNGYLQFAKNIEKNNTGFGAKTKYYSSILEELPVLIIENEIGQILTKYNIDEKTNINIGDLECIIRIAANPDGTTFYETKKIDFSVAINISGTGDIPLLGYEVKKYMDKTMFGTVIQTYNSLQIFRPRTIYGFIVEDEAREQNVVRNSLIYSNEFILTKSKRNESKRNDISLEEYTRFVTQLKINLDCAIKSLII